MVFDALKEAAREEVTGDDKFFLDMVYYFELQVPSKLTLSHQTNFLFPLVLGPESYTLSEPFAIAETETQGSGLFVEENGIIRRTLRLHGHTGWRPRKYKGSTGLSSIRTPDTGKSYARSFAWRGDPIADISGQRHFQFLQDAVFRTYGDLKRDPASSADTKMFFHIPKEDEHWEVKPVNFQLERTLEKRNLYYYDIELLIVGPADDPGKDFSEDKGLLDTIKDAVRMVQSAIDAVRAAITDVTNLVNEISRTIKSIIGIVNSVSSLISAAADFVNGATSVIKAPFQAVADITNNLTNALAEMVGAAGTFTGTFRAIPDSITNSFRQIQAAMDRLGSFPELFQTDTQRALEAARRGQELSTSKSVAVLQAAAATTPPNSFQAMLALGTANTPGDLQRARSELKINQALAQYQSADPHILGKSDTLQSLAAKFLKDARLYRHIAVLNNLAYPFISAEGIPGTKKPGDTILIPSKAKAPEQKTITPVLGVPPDAAPAVRVLGTDLKMERVEGPGDFFDWVVDVEGGSTGLKEVSGVENLQQAILARLRTERGTDQLYQNVGIDRVIGVAIPVLGAQVVGIRVAQCVRADPRIAGIRNLSITQPKPDAIVLDMDAEVIGISGTTPLNLTF